jgi:peptidoglycan hydrolase CwlO-like protein
MIWRVSSKSYSLGRGGKELDGLQSRFRDLESKYKDLELKNQNLQKEIDRLNGLLKDRNAEIDKLKGDNKSL